MSANDNNPIEILVVGPYGSGKTILIKSLVHLHNTKQMWDFNDVPSHMPTIGVDISTLNFSSKQRSNITVELKELGGQMAPIWSSYFKNIRGLIFVVDSSNPFSVAEATIELARCLKSVDLKRCYFLVVFSKSDITVEDAFSGHYFSNAMLLEPLVEEKPAGSHIEIVNNCSGLNCINLQKILHWIERIAFMPRQ